MSAHDERDGDSPDIPFLERSDSSYAVLFTAKDGEIAATVGRGDDIRTEFDMEFAGLLYDFTVEQKVATVTLGATHPDFPDAVQVWTGVLDAIEGEGASTMVRLLDGRRVPIWSIVALKIAPEALQNR